MDYVKNQYDVNKPYYKPITNDNVESTMSLSNVLSALDSAKDDETAKATVNALYNNYQIDDATLESIYALRGWTL